MTVAPDYFSFFSFPRRLSLDTAALQKKFYELSRQFHPDRFAARSAEEQQYALDATALLNDAYRVLRDPVRRAEYLLKLEGFDIGEQRSKDVPPELLEEVFELNMLREESSDQTELKERLNGMLGAIDSELEAQFVSHDSGDREALGRMRNILNRRRYIQNLVRDTERS